MTNVLKGLFLWVLLLLSSSVLGQNFVGKVTNKESKPIAGSTILIKEANQGIACNDQGAFQTTLKPGVYEVEYRCLGYESLTERVTIEADKKTIRSIMLHERAIALQEVVISNDKKRDLAYEIMRKAIDKAPYHQQLVKEYEADCYIKGDIELLKVSKLLDKLSSVDGLKMSDLAGNLFIQESYSTIKFAAPDSYEQTVKAFSSSAPDDINPKDAMRLALGSLYLPEFSGLISPLNPKAFSYYRFRYEGYIEEEGEIINKIKVIPKMKDPLLLSGDIYIANHFWDIRYADLEGDMYGIKQRFTIMYDPLAEGVYLPTTYNNKVALSILGTEGVFNYNVSLKYHKIVVNKELLIDSKRPEKKKKSLEIKWLNENYQIETDSLATKRDSVYWEQIRSTPLSEREEYSFVVKDSMQFRIDSLRKKHTNATFEPVDLLMGGQIGGDSTRVVFKYGGLAGALKDYNYVDGFSLGQKVQLKLNLNNSNALTFIPEVYYTTARKDLVWKANLEFDYAPMRTGRLSAAVGDVSTDFNPLGVQPFDEMASILFTAKNNRMLYRQKFIQVRNTIDLMHGLRLFTQIQHQDRSILENKTRYRFWGKREKIKENFQDQNFSHLLSYSVLLSYTPEHYYSVVKGRKRYRHSKYPTITLGYSEGFSSLHKDNARFKKLFATVNQVVRFNLFNALIYEVGGGAFLGDRKQMNFADFTHMKTAGGVLWTSHSPINTFMLLDPYGASTNKHWLYGHLTYHSKYLLFKRLPFLQGKMFDEAIHFKYLHTPSLKSYTEVGYSVDVLGLMSLGVYNSFHKFKHQAVNFRFSYTLDVFK